MTVLILSLWAVGILLLIAVAVYRGKRTSHAFVADEMSDVDLAIFSTKVNAATRQAPKFQRDLKTGRWQFIGERSAEQQVHYGKLVASAGKPIKPGKPGQKGNYVHFPKPGKSVR